MRTLSYLPQHLVQDLWLCLDQLCLPSTALDGAITSKLCRNPRKSSSTATTLAAMRNIVSYLRWSQLINRPLGSCQAVEAAHKATTCRTEPEGGRQAGDAPQPEVCAVCPLR